MMGHADFHTGVGAEIELVFMGMVVLIF